MGSNCLFTSLIQSEDFNKVELVEEEEATRRLRERPKKTRNLDNKKEVARGRRND